MKLASPSFIWCTIYDMPRRGASSTARGRTRDLGGPASLPVLRRSDLNRLAYDSIRRAIIDLELRPGERLVEATLAEQLGTSSVPVREALLMLERDGFVRIVPHRGAHVAPLERKDLEEIFELRELLEGRAAAHAAIHMPDEAVVRLEALVDQADRDLERSDLAHCHEVFAQYDDVIFDAAANDRLLAALGNLRDQVARIGVVAVAIPGRAMRSQQEHRDVMRAIQSRNPEAAESAMRAHVVSLRGDVLGAGGAYLVNLTGGETS
jgi:DNA-binding GntR family transcriptional regulator